MFALFFEVRAAVAAEGREEIADGLRAGEKGLGERATVVLEVAEKGLERERAAGFQQRDDDGKGVVGQQRAEAARFAAGIRPDAPCAEVRKERRGGAIADAAPAPEPAVSFAMT